jgi:hypothetical protein
MSKSEKLSKSIRNNPRAVRFDDAIKMAKLLGFQYKGGQGSHTALAKDGEPRLLNFQNRKGLIPPYQARQLIEMMDKYE